MSDCLDINCEWVDLSGNVILSRCRIPVFQALFGQESDFLVFCVAGRLGCVEGLRLVLNSTDEAVTGKDKLTIYHMCSLKQIITQ